MYFLLNMWIFQPAILIYHQECHPFPESCVSSLGSQAADHLMCQDRWGITTQRVSFAAEDLKDVRPQDLVPLEAAQNTGKYCPISTA